MSNKAGWRVPAGLMLGPFVALLDLSIVTVALPRMNAGLHAGTSGVQWVIDAYSVCQAALLLSGGTLGDRYGRKRPTWSGWQCSRWPRRRAPRRRVPVS